MRLSDVIATFEDLKARYGDVLVADVFNELQRSLRVLKHVLAPSRTGQLGHDLEDRKPQE